MIKLYPSYYRVYCTLVGGENEYRKIRLYVDKALSYDPNYLHAFFIKATGLSNLKKIREARNILKKALSIEPNNALALCMLGDL
jgi:Tfp pilus assembly protein PilF